jgi:methanogenic corrinoid protein MtbC1
VSAARLIEELLDRLARGDRRGAVARAHELLEEGLSPDELLELVTEAQREVGRRWERNEWSIVQEHTATAVSEDVVAAVAGRGTSADGASRGSVAVVCADGEWHILPARLFAEHLERDGYRVTFVGGSVPPEHLAVQLPRLDVDAVAVSVSISAHLPGAARTVAAAHGAGLPVLVGGSGFGGVRARAEAIGADGFATTPAQAAQVLASWRADPPAPLATATLQRGPADAIARDRTWLVERVVEDLAATRPGGPTETHVDEARAVEVGTHLGYLGAALALDDPAIYSDHLPWAAEVQRARGVDIDELRELTDALAVRLAERGHEAAAELVARTRRVLTSS